MRVSEIRVKRIRVNQGLGVVDYYIMQFDDFFVIIKIGIKAFFTIATLLMPLLENDFL